MTIYSDTLDGSDITLPFHLVLQLDPFAGHGGGALPPLQTLPRPVWDLHIDIPILEHQYLPHICRVYPNLEHPLVLLFSLLCHLLIRFTAKTIPNLRVFGCTK